MTASALPDIRPRPARSARPSRRRRISETALVVGSVLALAAAFGPLWLTRVGVGVAVTAAVVACLYAWRELFAAERAHAVSTLRAAQRHGRQLHAEREHNASVVDTLSGRTRELAGVVEGQRVTIAGLRHEVFGLQGDRTSLRAELVQRDRVVGWLRSTARSQEAEIAVLREQAERQQQTERAEQGTGELHHMPRRHRGEWAAVAEGSELATPTFAAVLPNYEEDRRRA